MMRTIQYLRAFASAVAACIVCLTPGLVSAQTSPANRSALMAKGYNQADFKAAELTQIGSNYLFYSEWIKCGREISQIVVMNDITDARVGLVFSQCDDKALALRAALARTISLEQATRAVSLLATDLGMQTRQLQNARRANEAIKAGSHSPYWQDGLWTVLPNPDGICAGVKYAGSRNGDLRDTLSMMIFPQDGNYQLRLIIGDLPDMPSYQNLVGKSFNLASVTSENSFQVGSMRQFQKTYNVKTNNYDVYFAVNLNDSLLATVKDEEELRIITQPINKIAPIMIEMEFNIGEVNRVLPKVKRCQEAQSH